MLRVIVSIIILGIQLTCLGQVGPNRKFAPEISGQVMMAGNRDELVLNLGGSGISFKFRNSTASINFLPSLNYNFPDKKLIPALGFGPQWQFKNHLLAGIPIYYTQSRWHATVGIGYRFQSMSH